MIHSLNYPLHPRRQEVVQLTVLDPMLLRSPAKLSVGDTASLSHIVGQLDLDLFSAATGDLAATVADPVTEGSKTRRFAPVQSGWLVGLLASLVDTNLPGPGSSFLHQTFDFHKMPAIGDTVTAQITVRGYDEKSGSVILDCSCTDQNNRTILTGTANVLPPEVSAQAVASMEPHIRVERHDRIAMIIDRAAGGVPVPAAIVMPVDAASLLASLEAARHGLISPVLIGPADLIRSVVNASKVDISTYRLIDVADARAAAARAVEMVHAGEVGLIIKGDLHTDDLMHPVIASATGLRTTRRISHVFVIDVPDYPRLLLVTDAAVNIIPTLVEKVDIVQNAINLAHLLGIAMPRVAILSAVELVNDRIPSTLDAAALCKMADRGQITGGLLDGPLAFDNAINEGAAKEKGIISAVAGRADILVVPDLEAGNMLAKQLTFLAGAEAAGVVIGASVPIVLTSRADNAGARLASCAVAVLMARSGSVT